VSHKKTANGHRLNHNKENKNTIAQARGQVKVSEEGTLPGPLRRRAWLRCDEDRSGEEAAQRMCTTLRVCLSVSVCVVLIVGCLIAVSVLQ
jgi:hypothetical protein